jgi:hypothetical protein
MASVAFPQISKLTELEIRNGYSAIVLAFGVLLELFLLTIVPKMGRKRKFHSI